MTHPTTPDLSIIIVSWNVRDLLADCLASIAAAPVMLIPPDSNPAPNQGTASHPPMESLSPLFGLTGEGGRGGEVGGEVSAEVIVLDSASSDNSAEMVRERFPWVHLIAETENIGFVRGNNRAFEIARGRHWLLLNPDTVIHDDALNRLVAYLDAHPEVGLAGPHVLNDDGTHQSTRRRFPTRTTAFFESTWLQDRAPRRLLDHFYMHDQPDDGTYEVDWVQGCALIARREVYAQIGGLDPAYVMFSEELDWCKRAKDAGWQVAYVGDAKITHYGGKSTEQVRAFKHIYFQQSKVRYFAKFHGRGFALALRLFLVLSYLAQLMIEGAKLLLGHKRDLRRARVKTYTQVIRALITGRQPSL